MAGSRDVTGRDSMLHEGLGRRLSEVDKRRAELWTVSVLVVASLAIALALFLFAPDFLPEGVDFGRGNARLVLALVGGLALAFLVYVFEKERDLRKLTQELIDQRVLSTALSNRLSEISRLSHVGKAINTTLDLDDVLHLIISSALELLGGTEGSVMLLDDDKRRLRVRSYHGPHFERVMGAVVEVGSGISGRVAERCEPLLLQGEELGGELQGEGHPERGIRSAMCVPLVRQDELLGVLNLSETEGRRTFSSPDLEALGFFAEHAAIAIGNARLFEKERETVQRLEELDRMKSDFVATVSHELKTPLTAIIGAAKTIGRRSDQMDEEMHSSFVEMIERQGNRLLRMVEDVLTTARIESGMRRRLKRELIDLSSLTKALIEDLSLGKLARDREITLRTEPARPHVWADAGALQQIMMNLIENALKYSESPAPVEVLVEETENEAMIAVSDHGQGLSDEELRTIFERFRQADSSSTRKVGGFGLGLYIVKQLVDEHGGKIDVRSEVGTGSTFTVRLPKRSDDRGRYLSPAGNAA